MCRKQELQAVSEVWRQELVMGGASGKCYTAQKKITVTYRFYLLYAKHPVDETDDEDDNEAASGGTREESEQ